MSEFKPRNPDYRAEVQKIFLSAPFVAELGIELVDVGPGWCESRLAVERYHQQQNGVVHAGVLASLADHTAGAAAGSLMDAGQVVLSVEFKINLLRPAQGDALRCRAQVLKAGRTLSVVESQISAQSGDESVLISTATVTLITRTAA